VPKISIFTSITNPEQRQDAWKEAIGCYLDFADEVVVIDGSDHPGLQNATYNGLNIWKKQPIIIKHRWPEEFDWTFIGQQFQRGYDACTGDWVLRMDIDYLIHENDFEDIRKFLDNCTAPVACMPKKQFLLADEYRVKSLIPIAFNKKKYGDRIKLDSGGDLCQPSLDEIEVDKEKMPIISRKVPVVVTGASKGQIQKRLPNVQEEDGVLYMMDKGIHIWNYECILRTKEVEAREFHRFAKAWERTFRRDSLGAESEDKALQKFLDMQLGRYKAGGWAKCLLEDHPKYMQEKIKDLTENQFGHSLWGNTDCASYFKK
jgi:glycosyltransferase involved in cell wall biosynthesis